MTEETLHDALRHEFGVQQLVKALTLSERFQFHLVTCSSARTADALFDVLRTDVSRARSEPTDIWRITPEGYDLVLPVLTRLAELSAAPSPGFAAIALDFALARPDRGDAFGQLFRRMNEQRNSIMKALTRPLLLVCPAGLHARFAWEAPDFWSIRSLAVEVTGPPVTVASPPCERWLEFVPDGFRDPRRDAIPDDEDEKKLRSEIANNNVEAFPLFIAYLVTRAWAHDHSGHETEAAAAFDEAIALSSLALGSSGTDDPGSVFNLLAPTRERGDYRYCRAEFRLAAEDYATVARGFESRLQASRRHDLTYGGRRTWLWSKEFDALLASGDLDNARPLIEALERDVDFAKWNEIELDETTALMRRGRLSQAEKQFDRALACFSEAVTKARNWFEQLRITRELASLLASLGELDAALDAQDHVQVTRDEKGGTSFGLECAYWFWLRARLLRARGDGENAERAYEEAAYLRSILIPPSPRDAADTAAVDAAFASERAMLARALGKHEEALALFGQAEQSLAAAGDRAYPPLLAAARAAIDAFRATT